MLFRNNDDSAYDTSNTSTHTLLVCAALPLLCSILEDALVTWEDDEIVNCRDEYEAKLEEGKRSLERVLLSLSDNRLMISLALGMFEDDTSIMQPDIPTPIHNMIAENLGYDPPAELGNRDAEQFSLLKSAISSWRSALLTEEEIALWDFLAGPIPEKYLDQVSDEDLRKSEAGSLPAGYIVVVNNTGTQDKYKTLLQALFPVSTLSNSTMNAAYDENNVMALIVTVDEIDNLQVYRRSYVSYTCRVGKLTKAKLRDRVARVVSEKDAY